MSFNTFSSINVTTNSLSPGFSLSNSIQQPNNLPSHRNASLHLHIPSTSPFYNNSLNPFRTRLEDSFNNGFQVMKPPSPFPQIFFSPEIIQSAVYPHPWQLANPHPWQSVYPKYYPLFE